MSVEGSCQTVVVELSLVMVSRAEVSSFVHAASCHDTDQFVEELILASDDLVQTASQIARSIPGELEAHSFENFSEYLQICCFGLGVSPQNAERWKSLVYFNCDCDIAEQHELLDEVVSLHQLVHLHISGAVGFFLECDLDLR
jgi:hypothetical protein